MAMRDYHLLNGGVYRQIAFEFSCQILGCLVAGSYRIAPAPMEFRYI